MKNPPARKTQTAKRNYQKEMEKVLDAAVRDGRVPTLFLHSCCAPCSSYVLEYLSQYFSITVFYYNPNISPKEEYEARTEESTAADPGASSGASDPVCRRKIRPGMLL